MDDPKETLSSKDNGTETHMNSQRLETPQDLHRFKDNKSQHQKGEVDPSSHP